ncbi:hypothetical protein D3C86_2065170 [compost metagenome]
MLEPGHRRDRCSCCALRFQVVGIGVIPKDPRRILLGAQPGVGVGDFLDPRGAFTAVGFIQLEGTGVVVDAGFGQASG